MHTAVSPEACHNNTCFSFRCYRLRAKWRGHPQDGTDTTDGSIESGSMSTQAFDLISGTVPVETYEDLADAAAKVRNCLLLCFNTASQADLLTSCRRCKSAGSPPTRNVCLYTMVRLRAWPHQHAAQPSISNSVLLHQMQTLSNTYHASSMAAAGQS